MKLRVTRFDVSTPEPPRWLWLLSLAVRVAALPVLLLAERLPSPVFQYDLDYGAVRVHNRPRLDLGAMHPWVVLEIDFRPPSRLQFLNRVEVLPPLCLRRGCQ